MSRLLVNLILTTFMVLLPAMVQGQDQARDIRVTITKAPKGPDAKPVETRSVELPVVILRADGSSTATMMAAAFDRTIGTDELFRIKIENGSKRDWSFLTVAKGSDGSCASVVPALAFSDAGFIEDGAVPVERVASGATSVSDWLPGRGGESRFAILASESDQSLRNIFMAVEFLAGLATGRAEPRFGDLSELKLGQPNGRSEAGEEYRSGRHRITITLGNVYSQSGESLRTVEYYDALLLIAQCRYRYGRGTVPFDALRVGWLNNRGLANYQTGRLGDAKSDYELALELLEKLKADGKPRHYERLVTLTNLGQVYATLGDQDAAIAKYAEAEKLSASLSPSVIGPSMVAVHGGMGTSLEYKGQLAEALVHFEKALTYAIRHRAVASHGIVLSSLGRLAATAGKRAEAEKYFEEAIALSERTKNHAGVGSASNNLGWFYVQDKRYPDARAAFTRSSEIFADLGNRTAQATALGNLMFVERLQAQPDAAIFFGKRAVRLLQSVRNGLTTVEKQLQRSFLVSREETYRVLADTLISRGRLIEAQAVLELLKDEEHAGGARKRSGYTAEVAPYTEAEESLQLKIDELALLRQQRAELQASRIKEGTAFTAQVELDRIDKTIALVNAAFKRSLERLAATESSVSERVKAVLGERNLQSTLSTLKKNHNTEAAAVYTVIGTEEVDAPAGSEGKKTRTKFGWTVLVTSTDRKAYPIDVAGLEETVRRFREALGEERYDPKQDAQKLYNAIFRQTPPGHTSTLEKDLEAALASSPNKTVMWSLDGVLRYVPVAALHDGKQYLVEKFRNVVFTSRSLGQLQATNSPEWKILAMGVSERRPGFEPLAGAKDELEYIVRPEMFEGEIFLNEKFRKDETLRVWKDKQYPVIHIASHFKFHPTKPEESYLLLGDGELKISDIENEDNLFDGVDLLALSACDTAMTNNGKESESLAYLAQDLGARTVLASLWPVSDAGTPELMTRFYDLRAADKQMTKGEAFHRAQLSLLRGTAARGRKPVTKASPSDTDPQRNAERLTIGGKTKSAPPSFVKDPRRPFAHPFYWAPFILIGNWR